MEKDDTPVPEAPDEAWRFDYAPVRYENPFWPEYPTPNPGPRLPFVP